jgi:hypothetical protein
MLVYYVVATHQHGWHRSVVALGLRSHRSRHPAHPGCEIIRAVDDRIRLHHHEPLRPLPIAAPETAAATAAVRTHFKTPT